MWFRYVILGIQVLIECLRYGCLLLNVLELLDGENDKMIVFLNDLLLIQKKHTSLNYSLTNMKIILLPDLAVYFPHDVNKVS